MFRFAELSFSGPAAFGVRLESSTYLDSSLITIYMQLDSDASLAVDMMLSV